MTVISALFSKKGIAVATDSMLTAVDKNGGHIYLEWQQPKIICVPKLRACISYWGFAGALKNLPQINEQPKWTWQTFEWLRNEALNPQAQTLEDFAKTIRDKLDIELNKFTFSKPKDKGIGLHIAGFENVEGYQIPELFLISNFADTGYQTIKTLDLSRNTFHSIANVAPSNDHANKEFRLKVKQHLDLGGLITYNNGDPTMFNTVSKMIFDNIKIAASLGLLKTVNDIKETIPLVRRPIEMISEIQKDFFLADKRLVGGQTHDLSIDTTGQFYSTSGVK